MPRSLPYRPVALVLTGLVLPAQRALVERLPNPPTYIVNSVTELAELL